MQFLLQKPYHPHHFLSPPCSHSKTQIKFFATHNKSILFFNTLFVISMAKPIFRRNKQKKPFFAVKLSVFCLFLLLNKGGATEFKVGGSKGWSIPSDPNEQSLNQWAEAHRFQTGDSLVFNYPADQDSVLQVSHEDYKNCRTEAPIKTLSNGDSVFKLEKSGPYYFISGSTENCKKNEKLVVVVLADRTNHSSTSPPPSDVTGNTPSPAPSGEESLSPPAGTWEINPTPSPVSEPPPNGASSAIFSFLGCFAAFAGSSLVLIF